MFSDFAKNAFINVSAAKVAIAGTSWTKGLPDTAIIRTVERYIESVSRNLMDI
jgi:hypothetical protein